MAPTHEMKARCPHCFGQKEDCLECKGTGFITATLNTDRGIIFFSCPTCHRDLGGRIPQSDDEIPDAPTGPSKRKCVFCSEENTVYEYVKPEQADDFVSD